MNHETRQHDDAQGERDNRRELTARRNFLLLLVSAPAALAAGCVGITEPTSVSQPIVQPSSSSGGGRSARISPRSTASSSASRRPRTWPPARRSCGAPT